ncbi:3-dehydroquinate synthase [Jatrophihabitans telluris]|uniref:Multifunctional fusion protein n=1 Tax=Jatrophihabitans telluris TaxID=2038343 RepID=A0ABY4QUI7_9ACTN|nr:3-dehydroquinate synthase [Jatrophihabitans telluris]UQX86782.1 3-dehydroquinate synthase [Jatrophihabitans telluris]
MSPRTVLVGLPGAGKSSVGRALAARLGVDFADTDDLLIEMTGRSVGEIFAHDGEAAFREIEAAAIADALCDFDGVLSLGGGAVTTPSVRAELVAAQVPVVELRASQAELVQRVSGTRHRPLLAGDTVARLKQLQAERAPLYAEVATYSVDTSGRAVADVAEHVHTLLASGATAEDPVADSAVATPEAAQRMTTIFVAGPPPYEVHIGRAILPRLVELATGADRIAIIHPETMVGVAGAVAAELTVRGSQAHLLAVPDGEAQKTLTIAGRCFDALGEWGFTRSDLVIGLGGGATTDLAGWVAASWLRGVRVIQVPTTVAGMVDAAVGGKTGINTGRGKNLVGAFYPPAAVLCDLDLLATLSQTDYLAGLAEVVKCGFIADPAILELIEADPAAVTVPGNAAEAELVQRSIAVKARVVSADLTEQGEREILNYGHTLGHAIERAENYRWRHGDAVSVGLVFAAELARRLGRLDEHTAARHRRILASLGLPVSYRPEAFEQLLDTMRVDKKARGSRIRFVVLDGLARPGRVEDADPELLRAVYEEVSQ